MMSETYDPNLEWRRAKSSLLLPIIYVRGYAMTSGEIDDTSSDPFNGFNVGSTLLRTGWTGASTRHIFESPVLRLSQPPYDYRLAFSDGLHGLDAEAKDVLTRETAALKAQSAELGRSANAVLAIYRYYDATSSAFGEGLEPGMETYGWGLARLILDILEATQAPQVYLVAHSMGGLVARTFLQNDLPLDEDHFPERSGCKAVWALLRNKRTQPISKQDWARAREAVHRFFTYGTPHKGITARGGFGNQLLSLGGNLGMSVGNFAQDHMREYLSLEKGQEVNSLGIYSVENTFCLVGTAASDYPAAMGMSRRLIGELSDGLVEIDNAVAVGPDRTEGAKPDATVMAARAYVRRAHSGPYGMVNSEEGFGNLSRFLFGDIRVEGDLLVRRVDLPPALQSRIDAAGKGKDAGIRASYVFESSLRVRGARWPLTERLARDGSAIFRRFDELFPEKAPTPGITEDKETARDRERHRRIDLFSAFLDTRKRTLGAEPDVVKERPWKLPNSLGFALRLRVLVPDYEVDGLLWQTNHYEGSSLLDKDLVFLAFQDPDVPGGWGLAWGPNLADGTNDALQVVKKKITEEPGEVPDNPEAAWRAMDTSVEFWLPLSEPGPPAFTAWLRLTARAWNQENKRVEG
ncbi:MAG: hypothetical protein JWR10_1740 [Rubritepida sp.]|nr:hypothetical protein [Rubritepida sp.]